MGQAANPPAGDRSCGFCRGGARAAALGVPVKDTVKQVDADGKNRRYPGAQHAMGRADASGFFLVRFICGRRSRRGRLRRS